MLTNPAFDTTPDQVVQLKSDSIVLIKGHAPIDVGTQLVVISMLAANEPDVARLAIFDTKESPSQSYVVHVGDTIPLGPHNHEILAIEQRDTVSWVEINSTPQP